MVVSLEARFNPILRPLTVVSGADRLAAHLGTSVGYAWTHQVGFSVRVLATLLWYVERTLAFGGNLTAGVGWVF